MELVRSLWATAIVLLCVACARQSDGCDYMRDGYTPLEGDLWTLEEYPLGQVPEAVVAEIQKCWAARPYGAYGDAQHSILLKEARKISANRYYLTFEPSLVNDIKIVFLVDKQRGVLDAYSYSTL